MSTLLRSQSRIVAMLASGAVRLLVAAMLLQPAYTVVRTVLPAESVEAPESESSGESESVESEATTAAHSTTPRLARRGGRRLAGPPKLTLASGSTAASRSFITRGSAAGHRLPNGLTAPLRC
jgi:hypothetical protein